MYALLASPVCTFVHWGIVPHPFLEIHPQLFAWGQKNYGKNPFGNRMCRVAIGYPRVERKPEKKFMASVTKRNKVWFAQWRDLNGKLHQKTIKVKVTQNGMTEIQTEKLARQVAAGFEGIAHGMPLEQVMEAVRAVAVLYGYAQEVPSIMDYLTNFPALGKERTEKIRQKAFRIFIEWLGMRAPLPLTRLTTELCREHIRYLLQLYRKGTVRRHRECLTCAMNRAVDVHHYLPHSPLKGISITQEM